MFKNFLVSLFLLGVVLVFSSCSVTKGVHVDAYIDDRERVDQEIPGNAGFLSGSSTNQATGPKRTRKVFVVEVSKEPTSADKKIVETEETTTTPVELTVHERNQNDDRMINNQPVNASGIIEYKVEKDDTLQKISKKFYDSYNKWPKIYEANKDVIPNPDKVKPGIVIKIPVE